MQQLRTPLTLYAFLFLVFTPAIGVFGGCGAVRVLFLLPAALGFTGDNGSGDDEPTLDTVDSRLDRLVRVRGVSSTGAGMDDAVFRVVRRRGVGGGRGATSSSASSSSSCAESSSSIRLPGMLLLRSSLLIDRRDRADVRADVLRTGSGSGSGAGGGDGSRGAPRPPADTRVLFLLPLPANRELFVPADTLASCSGTCCGCFSPSSSCTNAPGGNIASDSALALFLRRPAEIVSSWARLPLALAPRPKTETENSPETSMSALSSRWRATEIDSPSWTPLSPSSSESSESMLTSASCGPLMDEIEVLAVSASALGGFALSLPEVEGERSANADTGRGFASDAKRLGRFALVEAPAGGW